ncbi:MAG: C40 family peptidase [Candidatus Latescibacterota bacterium]|nr:MAG: C40 family peptidase [Candidatus Latescibacterota bacterium]
MIKTLHDAVSEALSDRSLDWRSCFVRIHPEPPDGRTVVFECSDKGVLDDVRDRISKTGGESVSVSYVPLPDPQEPLPELLIASGSVADVRKGPSHAAELVTQSIYGERVEPLKREGDWLLVRLDDGYLGWVRSWHLKSLPIEKLDKFSSEARHRVRDNIIQVFEEPSERGLPACDAVVGTVLIARSCGKKGWREVVFPDDRRGFAKARSLERIPGRRRVSRDKLASTGLRFLGVPYLWGGNTPKGFDCSGLMQRIFKLHGALVPRDSDLQSRFGEEKPVGEIDALDTGDLLFFGKNKTQITHVAMYLSNGLFLHAHGHVRVSALDPSHTLFAGRLVGDWQITRDPLSK